MANPRPPALHGLAMKWDTFYVITSEVLDLLCAAAGFVTIQVIPVTLSLQSRLFVLSGVFLYELYFLESFLGPQYVHPHCKNYFNHRVVHFSLFSLLLTRKYDLLQSIFIVAPTIPFRLLLPGTLPRWIIPLYLSFPPILHILTELEVIEPLDDMSEAASASHSMISFWPPSPALLGLSIAAVVRPMYNLFLARFRRWVLGTAPPPRQKRYLSNRVRSLLSFGRRAPAAVPAIMQDQDPARIVIADQIIQKDQSSLTHDIVHAVSCVAVPRIVGELLRLASSRSYYLRRFLGIRPPSMTTRTANWASMSTRQRAAAAGKAVAGLGLGGSWIWTAVDPVWYVDAMPRRY
ncbi:hypothetical protein B0H10DRAFT_54253 [Mycena sp. CBHHK59/15]|nr:hypothetical protein B0H10DRAFT_54253 [Mycena sp. CBHHK59/15]